MPPAGERSGSVGPVVRLRGVTGLPRQPPPPCCSPAWAGRGGGGGCTVAPSTGAIAPLCRAFLLPSAAECR
eukprot:3501805-Alexandrium_andersonii.AAC.1